MRASGLGIVAAFVVGCQTVRSIEQDAGWADVKLRIGPDALGGELLRDDGAGDTLYRRASEPPFYGRAPVGGIRYYFYDDVLWKIEVRTGSSKDFLPELTRHYGTPPFHRPWQWSGRTVQMNFLGHEYDSSALLVIYDKQIDARREAERPARLEAVREVQRAEAAARAIEEPPAEVEAP
jgi:hypothetical protein